MGGDSKPGGAAAGGLGAATLLFVMLYAAGGTWPFGIRMALAAAGLLFVAAAQALGAVAVYRSPMRHRTAGAAILGLGAAATVVLTPFGSMALAAGPRA